MANDELGCADRASGETGVGVRQMPQQEQPESKTTELAA